MASDKVKVAVRVRPMNKREIDMGTKICVDMDSCQTILRPLQDRTDGGGRKNPKTFAFDHCFWSMRRNDPKFADQQVVFNALGKDILERAYEGYNGCIFAYGQTGSGKSYTMMGTHEQKGIIPRLCDALFEHIAAVTKNNLSFKVEVSYMEIYNEKVHDLLDLTGNKQNLKVREHNILGPYVDGLSTLAVGSFQDIDSLMSEGNKSRTVAATNMNSESSRSHAVFNIIITQTLIDLQSGVSGEKVSKLSLVDLAGSERAQKTGAVGERLKEGSNINKSLTTLGLVISALADQAAGKNKNKFVPYRDSVLTWLLKDNLGGNSKTVMVATISPAADNYEETLSTLRYADRAKRIVNHAVINEDPNARIIRELREEVDSLLKQLNEAQIMRAPELHDRLEESEKLMKEMSKTWEEKLTETERIHQERHKALEQMGISVETSGIKVENSKAFLVNLNADPSLNELLVYYLKEHTMVGRPDAATQQDIQLRGLGIMPEHCIVDVVGPEVYITPLEGARTCVNGAAIHERKKVKHGDRILWGNNHFFRLNCPRPTNSPQNPESNPEQNIDYNFAQQELMMQELCDDPIQEAIDAIEKQHEEDKQEALEKQRQMYERQMQMLRSQLMSPGTPSYPFSPFDATRLTPTGNMTTQNSIQKKYQQWAQEREKVFLQSLVKLREEVVKANTLVREANNLAQEMGKRTEFHVTLQIPAANLSPNRKRGTFVSEPAIQVKRRGRPNQIWSMEKLENKIIDMREMYEERKSQGLPMMVLNSTSDGDGDADADFDVITPDDVTDGLDVTDNMDEGPPVKGDPFYESQENHNLIGVANIFLECLFYDVKLDYHVPIISQQGEVAGKLHVEVSKIGGAVLDRYVDLASDSGDEDSSVPMGAPLLVRVKIREARGLPPALCNFVFCQYSFWGQSEPIVVPPEVNPDIITKSDTVSFIFNHEMDFRIPISEEFIEHCSEGALSIEVWGHRSHGFGLNSSLMDSAQAKTRTLSDRWNEVMRKIEFWSEVHELNDQGEYMPVEVSPKPDVPSSGVFQLRQGHSRRILVRVKPVANSGTLPLICEAITSVSIGSICVRSKLQKGLDSYQEEDLNHLRERWSDALMRRKAYLDEQIQKLINKPDKSEADSERERALIEQWVCLTEERNAVLVPSPGSSIPGAPADWDPPPDMEEHSPVLFLDLNAEDMSTPNAKEGLQAAGINSILPKEHGSQFVSLPIIKSFTEKENVCALASWDSSMHDSVQLNRITPANERIYVILKAVVRLSHPASMELVLRKRICINMYKKQSLSSFTNIIKNRFYGGDFWYASGITYEVVSNIPKGSEDLEGMETLAQMAASQNETKAVDGETYIEKYIRGISAVESILTLDRLRQDVAVKELLAVSGRSLRKTTSVPNINQILTSPTKLEEQGRADSVQDLTSEGALSKSPTFAARPSFLNLRSSTNGNSAKPTPKSALSPHTSKLVKPMRTLIEEQHQRESRPLLHQDTEEDLDEEEELVPKSVSRLQQQDHDSRSIDSDDFQDFESYQSQQTARVQREGALALSHMTHSSTNDSLVEVQAKSCTPSMTSSGYGSQAVSTLTLSSEDSLSVKSIDDNENVKNKMAHKSGSTEHSGESEDEHAKGDNAEKEKEKNADAKSDSQDSGDNEAGEKRKSRSDSLLDENVPEIPDAPLKPIPSPPPNGEHFDFSQAVNSEEKDEAKEEKKEEEQNSGHEPLSRIDSNTSEPGDGAIVRGDNDNDPYSVTAMEELEKLGEDESLDGETAEKTVSGSDKPENNQKRSVSESEDLDKKSNGGQAQPSQPVVSLKSASMSNIVSPKTDKSAHVGSGQKTPDSKGVAKRKSSGSRQRPMSCIVSPQIDTAMRAWQEDLGLDRRNSLHMSEDQLNSMDDSLSECSFGSRADLDRLHDGPVPSWIQEGEFVTVTSSRVGTKTGQVRFVGNVEFAAGPWIGVELDLPEGKNDGSVNGVRYFKCRQRHGVFVRSEKLIWDKKRKGSKKSLSSSRRSLVGSSSNLSHSSSNVSQNPSACGAFMRPTSSSSAKKK